MQFFHIAVLGVSSIILLIVLIYIGISLYNAKKNTVFPPTQNTCPDGWMFNSRGMCQMPASGNVGAITTSGDTTATSNLIKSNGVWGIMPESTDWVSKTGKTAICAKHAWANKYGVTWDGVSNYNSCK
jgi:hypothetical protein